MSDEKTCLLGEAIAKHLFKNGEMDKQWKKKLYKTRQGIQSDLGLGRTIMATVEQTLKDDYETLDEVDEKQP